MTTNSPARLPLLLTLAGLIPFVGLALFIVVTARYDPSNHDLTDATAALLLYSVTILSFLGGIRWGIAIAAPPVDRLDLSLSVIPFLFSWLIVLVVLDLGYARAAFNLLALCFAAQWWWDRLACRAGKLPYWFEKIRAIASVGAIASLLLAAISYPARPPAKPPIEIDSDRVMRTLQDMDRKLCSITDPDCP